MEKFLEVKTGITWAGNPPTTVYAAETKDIIRNDGVVLEMRSEDITFVDPELCNPAGTEELSVGQEFSIYLDAYDGQGNKLSYGSTWNNFPDSVLIDVGFIPTFYSDYDSIEKAIDDNQKNAFQGAIPSQAFGKYVYQIICGSQIDENGDPIGKMALKYIRSKYPITDWGDTDYQTFALNDDEKTVSVFSIFDSTEPCQASFQKYITVADKKYKVTGIGSWALDSTFGSGGLTSVTLHSGITSIGENAFKNASKLKTITIEGNLKSVGKNAFSGINKKAVFKIKASKKNYDKIVKLIKKSGVPKTVKFKRITK